MEIQNTANRQIRSGFEIASIPSTGFGSKTTKKVSICSHCFESAWKHNTQHIAKLSQYLGLRQSQILILEA